MEYTNNWLSAGACTTEYELYKDCNLLYQVLLTSSYRHTHTPILWHTETHTHAHTHDRVRAHTTHTALSLSTALYISVALNLSFCAAAFSLSLFPPSILSSKSTKSKLEGRWAHSKHNVALSLSLSHTHTHTLQSSYLWGAGFPTTLQVMVLSLPSAAVIASLITLTLTGSGNTCNIQKHAINGNKHASFLFSSLSPPPPHTTTPSKLELEGPTLLVRYYHTQPFSTPH